MSFDIDLEATRQDTPPPEDGITFQKMLASCRTCPYLKVKLIPDHTPHLDDAISWLLAHENVVEISCDAGRIRYGDGTEKYYKTKYPLTIDPEYDEDCPDHPDYAP